MKSVMGEAWVTKGWFRVLAFRVKGYWLYGGVGECYRVQVIGQGEGGSAT